MIINNLELSFDRQEGTSLFFKTSLGEEISIDEKLLMSFSNRDQKLFLNLDSKEIFGQSKDILNEILETNNE
ncbi:MAG: hypothetical protein WCV71_04595 [Patescibacteria group bacterium]|jgi:hypothetical protein